MTTMTEVIRESIPDQQAANALMERLIETAKPEAVFSKPVTQGEYMVITAAEVTVGLGFGYGGGGGFGAAQMEQNTENAAAGANDNATDGGGFGGGGGGGGGAGARPVAAIEIGPNGVRVEPIFDPTKVLLAFFTTLGAMVMMLSRMSRTADKMSGK